MKVKTSITLSQDLLEEIVRRSEGATRSEFIEKALRSFIKQMIRSEQNERDLEIINKRSAHLNREARDVLSYQVEL